MAFTKALYYPYIRVQNESWLKTALLYWDKIQTIVPESFDSPYSGRASREFADAGLLVPLKVNPDRPEIRDISQDVLAYLNSSEAAGVLAEDDLREWAYIHPEKLPHEIRNRIQRHFGGSERERPQWQRVSPQFGHFYMSLLASKLADNLGLGLLTDKGRFQNLTNSSRLDVKLDLRQNHPGGMQAGGAEPKQTDWVQGYMADLILGAVKLAPNTSPKKIIKYREKHKDEIGRFRREVSSLTKNISRKQPVEAIQQTLRDSYKNRVTPALGELKASLTDLAIEHSAKNFLKIGLFSISGTSLPVALLGLSVPYALIAGVGLYASLSAVLYNRAKKALLRKNPYSYVLAAEGLRR